jgi:CheY-specific phosphatase CheX
MMTPIPVLSDEVHGHLNRGIVEVFDTMLGLAVKPAVFYNPHAPGQTIGAGFVRFDGDVSGVFHIQVTAPFARTLASRMLDLTEAELNGDEMVNDVIGELSNMIVAGVKSHLCGAGTAWVLSVPQVTRTDSSRIERPGPSDHHLLTFRCGADQILVEFLMKTDLLTWL